MARLKIAHLIAAAALVAIASLARSAPAVAQTSNPTEPALYENLPINDIDANAAFRQRVERAFPIGSPEDQMTQKLAAQNFLSDSWFGNRMSWRRESGPRGTCSIVGSVSWTTDSQKRILSLSPAYLRTPGCAESWRR